jgi:sec-independent protein translocase protein TatB
VLAIFNSLGGGELIAILVIALIVLGPEKLPEAIRKFGNIYGELRRMSHGFQSELRDAFDEPLRELRGTAQMMQDAVNDPVQSITNQMKTPGAGGGAAVPPADTPERAPEPEAETVAPTAAVEEVQAPVEDDLHGDDDLQGASSVVAPAEAPDEGLVVETHDDGSGHGPDDMVAEMPREQPG